MIGAPDGDQPRQALDEQAWREALSCQFGRLRPAPVRDVRPTGSFAGAGLGTISVWSVEGSAQHLSRTARAVAAEPVDLIKVSIQLSGHSSVVQEGRTVHLEPGQLAVYDTGRPYELRFHDNWSTAVCAIPRDRLGLPWHSVELAMARAHPADRGPGALLRDLIKTFAIAGDAAGAIRIGDAGASLLAATLAGSAVDATSAPDVLREQVLRYVRVHLADPGLDRSSIAVHFGLSPRSLDRLFQHEPASLATVIRSWPLDSARGDLADPAYAQRSVAAIARRWCFADAAHFSRAFRAEFGTSPRELRADGVT